MIEQKNIKIDLNLFNFINSEVLNDLNISIEDFWNGFSDIVDIYYKKNNDILNHRKKLQTKINEWHIAHKSQDIDLKECKNAIKKNTRNYIKRQLTWIKGNNISQNIDKKKFM